MHTGIAPMLGTCPLIWYFLSFCPTKVAFQVNQGDLSNEKYTLNQTYTHVIQVVY